MAWIVKNLWLIPLLPFVAAGFTALLKRRFRKLSAGTSIVAIFISFILSLIALLHILGIKQEEMIHEVINFTWFSYGDASLKLGLLLDPLSAIMLFVVSFVSLLVFIFSVGYMDHDENFTRFFCFLSLFAGSMLALVIANSLLLLFMAWELVGLSSFLLIGFWFHKPTAVAAMKKAFITTRIGDVGFLIGLIWFYSQTGASLFYDQGQGALEGAKLAALGGGSIALCISLLIFCGAMGKSGQFPLHVWLPDAMEGPTPVSALIHAATMVAAGVFLVGRMYPLFEINPTTLQVVTFIGAFTAIFAATIAVAQWDIKRILAYSTISQLGYMMMGLGMGGYVAGLFHLFTHAFFKALLFLGSGSIIHACHHEQDIRKMGGLKTKMPWTFMCYGIGALALSGFPGLAGFFSKDELLLDAYHFSASNLPECLTKLPFYLGLLGTFLTAFYMTRQMKYVFFGHARSESVDHASDSSPWMLLPLAILGFMSITAGFLNFPGYHSFGHFLSSLPSHHSFNWNIMLGSILIVLLAIMVGWKVYHGSVLVAGAMDPLEKHLPSLFRILHHKYYIDEFYEKSFIAFTRLCAQGVALFDRWILNGLFVLGSSAIVYVFALMNQLIDDLCMNKGFDRGCSSVRKSSSMNQWIQNGLSQHYLKITCAGIVLLFLLTLFLGHS